MITFKSTDGQQLINDMKSFLNSQTITEIDLLQNLTKFEVEHKTGRVATFECISNEYNGYENERPIKYIDEANREYYKILEMQMLKNGSDFHVAVYRRNLV